MATIAALIWGGHHGQAIKRARALLSSLRVKYDYFQTAEGRKQRFHDTSLEQQYQGVLPAMFEAQMMLLCALYSAYNAPQYFLERDFRILQIEIQITELFIRHHKVKVTPQVAETLMAYHILLFRCEAKRNKLSARAGHYGKIREYRDIAVSLESPRSTKLLALARVVSNPDLFTRGDYTDAYLRVEQFLDSVRRSPESVTEVNQGWKTYVRLARMLHLWGHMFFGLMRDRSPDLWVKSLAYFALNFWK